MSSALSWFFIGSIKRKLGVPPSKKNMSQFRLEEKCLIICNSYYPAAVRLEILQWASCGARWNCSRSGRNVAKFCRKIDPKSQTCMQSMQWDIKLNTCKVNLNTLYLSGLDILVLRMDYKCLLHHSPLRDYHSLQSKTKIWK